MVEAKPALVSSITIMTVSFISYSAMAGLVGGGGIGDFAIRYGYYRYETAVMIIAIVLMIVLVTIVQSGGTPTSARTLDKRPDPRSTPAVPRHHPTPPHGKHPMTSTASTRFGRPRLLLSAFVMNTPSHIMGGQWRHPEAQQHRFNELSLWTDLARQLEDARFDAMLLRRRRRSLRRLRRRVGIAT